MARILQQTFLDMSLLPSRSLSRRGFFWLMVFFSAITGSVGVYFYLKGAWPILGFFGLDLLLLYWAFKVSYKTGAIRERVHLNASTLSIERQWPGARPAQSWSLHPSWVQINLTDAKEHTARLCVRDRATTVELGRFLPPEERSEVAELLEDGLSRRKQALLEAD